MRYLLMTTLLSCGSYEPVSQNFDPDLISIVREYEADIVECDVKVVNSNLMKITYVDEFSFLDGEHATDNGTVGIAVNYEASRRIGNASIETYHWGEIQVLSFVKPYCRSAKKALVYHELGHYSLNKEHVPEAGHIMSAALQMTDCEEWDRIWNHELNIMFGKECKNE